MRLGQIIITLVGVSLVFAKCGRKDNSEQLFKVAAFTTNAANKRLHHSTEVVIRSLQAMSLERGRTRAVMWLPNAIAITEIAGRISTLLQAAGSERPDGNKIWDSIQVFKRNMLEVDQLINMEFSNEINSFPLIGDSTIFNEKFIRQRLATLPQLEINYFIGLINTQVCVLENDIASFCLEQVPSVDHIPTYIPIIHQNSAVFGEGQEMEIVAGIGSFHAWPKPTFKIAGRIVELNESAAAVYKFRVPQKPGKYSVPVRIEYTDQEGRVQYWEEVVSYTVAGY